MRIEPADIIVFTIVIGCLVLIFISHEAQAWGALVAVVSGYLAKKYRENGKRRVVKRGRR